MEKTSIRINNHFIVKKNGEYFSTDVDILNDWKEDMDIDSLTLKNVNQQVNDLINTYKIHEKVNFIVGQMGGG
jgi:hypothetical protein